MSNNNKSKVSQALLSAEKIKAAIKEESKNTIKSMLAEAVKEAVRDTVDDEKDYEVIDDKDNKAEDTVENGKEEGFVEKGESADEDNTENVEEPADEPAAEAPAEGEGDEWTEFSQYQAGDEDTYDLTGAEDHEDVVKVFKLLKPEDQLVVVKKDGDQVSIKDEEAGTEYVIELGETDENSGETAAETMVNEEADDIAGIDDEEEFDDDIDDSKADIKPEDKLDVDFSSDDDDDDDDYVSDEFDFTNDYAGLYEKNNRFEGKKSRNMKKKELVFEVDLGYTDDYQNKDVIQGLSNDEPSKSGRSWDQGVPKGTEKPWAGETEDKGTPFEETVNENYTTVKSQKRHKVKTRATNSGEEKAPEKSKSVSVENEYKAQIDENASLKKENKMLKKEIASLKEAVKSLRKNINEAYVTNVNLGKITRLFLENTTTQEEKMDIVDRFVSEAKTVQQSEALYESIKRELNKNVKKSVIAETPAAENSNADKVYESKDLLATIDLMNRVMNC